MVVSQVGFKLFLGVTANVSIWNSNETECSLLLDDNPLVGKPRKSVRPGRADVTASLETFTNRLVSVQADYVELPPHLQGLCYCNILCGVLRGALEMVSLKVEATFGR